MKKFLNLIFISALLFQIGCEKSVPGKFNNSRDGYSIQVPLDWQKAETPVARTLALVGPSLPLDQGGPWKVDVTITLIAEHESLSLEDLAHQSIERYLAESEYRRLLNQFTATIDGEESLGFMVEQTLYGGNDYVISYFCKVNGRIYSFNFHTNEKYYSEVSDTISEILSTVQFKR